MIYYGKQKIDDDDINQVLSVLKSDFLTQGPQVPLFEEEFSKFTGAEFSVAVNSATSALHIACLALGLGDGDRLWTVPNSFVASANCGRYCGADVDFVDIDPNTLNISIEALDRKLQQANLHNKLPKVIIPVHFAGASCDMSSIRELTQDYGIKIIEDASHAVGAQYQQDKVGKCTYSDITVFSFHPVKIITTGEGGIATTNDQDLSDKMRLFRSHGVSRNFEGNSGPKVDAWYYEQRLLGYNYRMTDIQAALGRTQLQKADEFVKRRREIAKLYLSAFSDIDITLPYLLPQVQSSWHLFPIQLNKKVHIENKNRIYNEFQKNHISLNVHYIPIHLQPYYQDLGFKRGDFPVSEKYYQRAFSLPLYPGMNDDQLSHVIDVAQSILT